ncbi:MAG: flagellar hook-basal body complex protein [Phycisphaeraceae bacterium]|nr:MAG: flagellar hook-basal body complex protein [Phycisphaeraceae bacterium]
MASTTAFYTALSGLNAHARKLDVIGNNIANVNTTSYKQTRLNLENRFPRNYRPGHEPGDTIGGTNPYQIGLGVGISGTQRSFTTGSISPTGDPLDVAIDGDGFFLVQSGDNTYYTRNGALHQDANSDLVAVNGEKILGYGVDSDYNVVEDTLAPINLPIGGLQIAEPTTLAHFAGNLNAGGDEATAGSVTRLLATATGGFETLDGDPAASTTALTDIADPGTSGALFAVGQTIRLDGATRGGAQVPTVELDIAAETTIADLLSFLDTYLGVHDTDTANPDGLYPGATIDPDTGIITVVGNTGANSTIEIDPSDLKLIDEDGSLAALPFVTSNDSASTGESDRSGLIVYDSLGNAVEVSVQFTLESKTASGTTWRYDLFSPDNEGGGQYLSSGTVDFDSIGALVANDPITVSVSRAGTGAVTPLTFTMLLSSDDGRMTALADNPSQFSPVFRDGVPTGTLEQFAINDDGLIIGAFDNGVTRTLGQIALARFINNQGLVDEGGSLYNVGPNSGEPTVYTPGEGATGPLVTGALELSNVDLGQEFIDLILTSTGYSASSRVIQTTDQLMQQLLVLGR